MRSDCDLAFIRFRIPLSKTSQFLASYKYLCDYVSRKYSILVCGYVSFIIDMNELIDGRGKPNTTQARNVPGKQWQIPGRVSGPRALRKGSPFAVVQAECEDVHLLVMDRKRPQGGM